jgi:NTE family protein
MGANRVIAVDISSSPDGNASADTLQLLLQTFTIMGKSINTYALRDADLVIKPALSGMKGADFGSRKKAIEAGRAAMQQALPQLKLLMAN